MLLSIAPSALPIGISGIEKRFGGVSVLRDLSLDVAAGEFLTLLGPSGSGKTTLLMILAGFVRANAGSIKVGGEEIIAMPPHRRNIGMVFQNYALFPHMNVFHNIAFPLKQRRVSAADTAERVEKALDLVQLKGLGERRVDQLSGGQRQRVALARAIVFEPRIVLMDEPLSALDKGLREHMQIELRNLHRRLGMTTVYVTHDQREAITMSDRIAVMNAGRIEQIDRPEVLYARPQTRLRRRLHRRFQFHPGRMPQWQCLVRGQEDPHGGNGAVLRQPPDGGAAGKVAPGHRRRTDGQRQRAPGDGRRRHLPGRQFRLLRGAAADGQQVTLRDYCRSDVLARLPRPGEPVNLGIDAEDVVLVAAD